MSDIRPVKAVAVGTASQGASGFSRLVSQILILPIRFYQTWISPMSGPTCRFYPSCSHYAVRALTVHGPIKGLVLGAWRICRCHPWTPGGVDMVPARGSWRSEPIVRSSDLDQPAPPDTSGGSGPLVNVSAIDHSHRNPEC